MYTPSSRTLVTTTPTAKTPSLWKEPQCEPAVRLSLQQAEVEAQQGHVAGHGKGQSLTPKEPSAGLKSKSRHGPPGVDELLGLLGPPSMHLHLKTLARHGVEEERIPEAAKTGPSPLSCV